MFFPFIMIVRLLFAASMVFIIGYVFGGFSKKRSLTRLTKVAVVLIIVLFVAANIFFTRQLIHGHKDGRFGGFCTEQSHTP
ncbi:hypothetical protein GCM10011386_02350 [Parapedobacter defluvii]|uniref:Uncharacterized protein n=1 Tax=Parapedobacter defluvii TaxID=2045106 RepID=A0ABQ1L129_9SPHI|nr:hypothetical protein [Parapedobacter defluvii]RQP13379.1 MAG: hypothetical protein EAS52_19685 [Parapedobacter sp.]GGC14209.1 hypothetical protein GCM10011386_02350 [Parapedobacter defluvii]